jgi:myo-inositol 2-dehydrogenase/D-chiro-inositol 1-dehydrogenase
MINFGIVGLGRIGKIHLSNVQRYCPEAQVLAASPVKPKHQAFLKENGVAFHFETYEEMVQDASIDAVIIASPTAFHYNHILLAAQAGKHIFCEKPIDLAYEKVKNVTATVAAAGIHFMVGFNRRFDPHIQELKAAIDLGKAGSPRIVKITSRDPAPPPLEFIKHSGGLFLDMAIHDFDMARYLIGDEVVQVSSTGNIFGDLPLAQYDDIDTAVTTLIFKKGCMVQIDNSRYSSYGYDQRLEVFGENGMVATQNILENALQISDSSGHLTARSKLFFIERYADSYRNIMMDFVTTLNNKQAPSISAEDGLAALAIAMAAKKSVKENRPISIF